jgi:hypothetical protein
MLFFPRCCVGVGGLSPGSVVSFSASFDPDDPTLIDRYPDYTTETDPGERPPTPTQQRGKNSASEITYCLGRSLPYLS